MRVSQSYKLTFVTLGWLLYACHAADSNQEWLTHNGQQPFVWLLPTEQARFGLQTQVMDVLETKSPIRIAGRVDYDDLLVAHVMSPVGGRVVEVTGKLGQQVQVGSPLVKIFSPDMSNALSDEQKAQADFTAAKANHVRQDLLYSKGAAALEDADNALDTYKAAEAELLRARKKVELLQGGMSNLVSMEPTYMVRSPIAGEVMARFVNPGEEIQGQYTGSAIEIFTVANLARVAVWADVFVAGVSRIRVGQAVQITSEAYPRMIFHGSVDWLAKTFDPTTHTIKVRSMIDNPNHWLKPNMYVNASIEAIPKPMLSVPKQSLVRMGDKWMVFVQTQTHPDKGVCLVRRPVLVDDQAIGDNVPVLHGLQAKERIVTQGAAVLAERFGHL